MQAGYSRRDFLDQLGKLSLAMPALSLLGCEGENARADMKTFSGSTMGTSYSVKITGFPEAMDRTGLKAGMQQILQSVNAQMSTWRRDSEITKFNKSKSSDWRPVSPGILAVMNEALRITQFSEGAFDPSIGSLVELWGFGPGENEKSVPSRDRIESILARQKSSLIHIRRSLPSIAKTDFETELDLSGIAKGFAVDKIAEYLERSGITNYLVEIGGELKARGHSAHLRSWWIGVEKPIYGSRAIQRIVRLENQAIATSGNYRNFFNSGGSVYSHILDPRTGGPITHELASVTVLAPSAMRADALSTALMVLGPDSGIRLAHNTGIAALFVIKEDKQLIEISTQEFRKYQVG